MQAARLAVHYDSTGSPLLTAVAYVDRVVLYRHNTNTITPLPSSTQSNDDSIPTCKVEHEDDKADGGDDEVDQSGNQNNPTANQTIRILSFSTDGSILAVGGEDRKVSFYQTNSQAKCVAIFAVHRRPSTGCFIDQSVNDTFQFMCSDKTGDIYCLSFKINQTNDQTTAAELSAKISLGHLSTITQISYARSSKESNNQSSTQTIKSALLTSDSDGKVRVSRWPNTFVIDTFCLADTSFVSCFECIHDQSINQSDNQTINNQALVLVGGVGNTVRLFDRLTGERLSEFQLPHESDFISAIKYDPSNNQTTITAYPSKHIYVYQIGRSNNQLISTIDVDSSISAIDARHGCITYIDEKPSLNQLKFNPSTKSHEAAESVNQSIVQVFTPSFETIPQSVAGLLYQRRNDLAERQLQIEKSKAEKASKKQKKGKTDESEEQQDQE